MVETANESDCVRFRENITMWHYSLLDTYNDINIG